MNIVCLDLEGVLVPEIWIAFSEESGIPELRRTTRDEPDYDKLMKYRIAILKEHKLAPLMLGNGTNLLFPDEGLKDLFIISTEKLTKLFLLPDGSVYAEAGVSLAKLASFAQQNGLAGLEFASGIPGSVGGGLMMNAGAYGGELKDAVASVVIHFLPEQALYELTNEQCAFGYRSSFFQKTPGCVIVSAVFKLEKGDPEAISEKMRELNAKRREKQPLDLPSVGGAQVSEKHAGFVVNIGGATSHDVHELMKHIRRTVYEHSKVVLEPEMILLPPDYRLEDHGPQVPLHRVWGAE